VVNNL